VVASGNFESRAEAARHSSARGFKFGRHVGNTKLERLKLVEPTSKRPALFHVGKRFLKSGLSAAQ
jgi:hypothetical protein